MIRRRPLLQGVLLALTATFLLLPAAPAQAHATIESTSPTNGTQLATSPAEVTVVFDEAVVLGSADRAARVVSADGTRVDTGAAILSGDHKTLSIPVKPDLPKAVYIATWSVVSADSHPVGGSLQFGVGVPATLVKLAPDIRPDPGLALGVGLAKGTLYLGLLLGLGVLPAFRILRPQAGEQRGVSRIAGVGLLLAILASAAQWVLQWLWDGSATGGGGVTAEGAAGAYSADSLAAFATSSYSVTVLVRALLLVGLLFWVRLGAAGPWWRFWIFAAAGAGVVALVVPNGHGGAGPWWQFVSTFLHATAAITWLGGLVVLGWLLLRQRLAATRLAALSRWSLLAGLSATVLLLSGLLQGVIQVRFPQALFTTQYGVVLLVKAGLVLVTGAIAAASWLWVRREKKGHDSQPAPGRTASLRRRVRWEAGMGAAVVIVSGVLSTLTPAQAAYAPGSQSTTAAGPYAVSFAVAPVRKGPESFRIAVTQPSGKSALPQEVKVLLSSDDGAVTGLKVPFPYRIASENRPGQPVPVTFTSSAVSVPATGEWTATITVVAGQFEQFTTAVKFTVL